MLNVTQLTKTFGAKIAASDVSFTIAPGEVFALIGPNSSGKTTIVKSILGMLAFEKGTIVVDGIDVTKKPVEAKARIGYIPDEPVAWSGMTGEEFLHFVSALYDVPPTTRAERIARMLPIFHLEGIEKEYFTAYSRGNKQKFSILSALLHEPKLLLVDEPIVGLDPESATIAKGEFVRFAKDGGAVLLVTHTLSVAEEIAHRIGVLKEGKLLAVGTFAELREMAGLGASASLEEVYTRLTTR